MAWLDTGHSAGMLNAAQYVEAVQSRQGFYIACIEEIAWEERLHNHRTAQIVGQEVRKTPNTDNILLSIEP